MGDARTVQVATGGGALNPRRYDAVDGAATIWAGNGGG